MRGGGRGVGVWEAGMMAGSWFRLIRLFGFIESFDRVSLAVFKPVVNSTNQETVKSIAE